MIRSNSAFWRVAQTVVVVIALAGAAALVAAERARGPVEQLDGWRVVGAGAFALVLTLLVMVAFFGRSPTLRLPRAWQPAVRRSRKGLCPRCAYDLRWSFHHGCPECGWKRR